MGDLYLRVAGGTAELLADRSVADHWDDPSVLPHFTVSGLAGHLARSVLQVEWYLDADVADAPPITASRYYADLVGVTDPGSELNVAVRQLVEVATLRHGPLAVLRALTRAERQGPEILRVP